PAPLAAHEHAVAGQAEGYDHEAEETAGEEDEQAGHDALYLLHFLGEPRVVRPLLDGLVHHDAEELEDLAPEDHGIGQKPKEQQRQRQVDNADGRDRRAGRRDLAPATAARPLVVVLVVSVIPAPAAGPVVILVVLVARRGPAPPRPVLEFVVVVSA